MTKLSNDAVGMQPCILILRVVGIDGMVKLNSLLHSAERNCTEYLSNTLQRFV